MAGLASLTANYTDSEDEDTNDQTSPPKEDTSRPPSGLATLADRLRERDHSGASGPNTPTPSSVASGSNLASARSTPTKKARLVSYVEEGADEDDEEDEDTKAEASDQPDESVPMELDSENEGQTEDSKQKTPDKDEEAEAEDSEVNKSTASAVEVEAWNCGGKLPPEPQGLCDPKVQDMVTGYYNRMKQDPNFDLNKMIQNRKSFRNPSIYEKLISFCEIDEHGTNFPKELYDGHLFGKESYYEELQKAQNIEMEKREKAVPKVRSHQPRAEVPVAVTLKKAMDEAGTRRKSKWDQAAPTAASRIVTNPNVPLPSVPAPQVVSAGAVKSISAFGPLRK